MTKKKSLVIGLVGAIVGTLLSYAVDSSAIVLCLMTVAAAVLVVYKSKTQAVSSRVVNVALAVLTLYIVYWVVFGFLVVMAFRQTDTVLKFL